MHHTPDLFLSAMTATAAPVAAPTPSKAASLTCPTMTPFVIVSRVAECPCPGTYNRPELCAEFWAQHIATKPEHDKDKEHLYVLALDTKFKLKAVSLVAIGSLNEAIATPREIFKPLIALGAYAFVLMHNHPSGDPYPSDADRRLTARIEECGKMLQIPIMDHVIFGTAESFFSFRATGLLA